MTRDGAQERGGVRLGQRVRDLDGRDLGRVTALYDDAFAVSRGVLLFRRDAVAGYDEVREVRDDGELVLARSARDLDELARGGIPPSWRIPAAGPLPSAATPPEARLLPGAPPAVPPRTPPAARPPPASPWRPVPRGSDAT